LSFFDVQARIVKSAFRASYYASIEYAFHHWGRPKDIPKNLFGRKQSKEASTFFAFSNRGNTRYRVHWMRFTRRMPFLPVSTSSPRRIRSQALATPQPWSRRGVS
jgi:hypothetical protein